MKSLRILHLLLVQLIFLLNTCVINAQTELQIDSLSDLLTLETTDSVKVFTATDLIAHYEYSNLDSARFYLSFLKKMGEEGSDLAMLNFYHFYLRLNKVSEIDLEESIAYFEEGILLSKKLNHHYKELIYYHLMGVTWLFSDNEKKAIDLFFSRIAIAEEYEMWAEVCRSYQMIAFALSQSNNSEKAFKYLEKAEEICQTHDIKEEICLFVYSGLGDSYKGEMQFKNAIIKYEQAIAIAEKLDKEYFKNIFTGNMATCYSNIGELELAEKYYKDVLQVLHEKFPTAKYNIAVLEKENCLNYYKNKKYQQAVRQVAKVDTTRLENDAKTELYDVIGKSFLKLNNTKKAVEYFQSSLILKDSLYAEAREMAIADIEANYQLSEKEQQIQEVNSKLKQKNLERNIVLIITLAFFIILILGVFSFLKLKKRKQQLDTINNELKLSNQKLQQFNYTLSHDALGFVNNILNYSSISLESDFFQDKDLLQKHILRILKNAKTLKNLLVNLLNIAKLGAKETIPKSKVFLNQIIEDVLENLNLEIKEKNVKIILSEFPIMYGNQGLLFELFKNLIDNAIKYSKENVTPTIEIEISSNKFSHQISIKDNGIGIQNEKLRSIFSPFSRIAANRTAGTGLGLSICEHIVKLHKGSISASSVKGEGTTFLVSLPVKEN